MDSNSSSSKENVTYNRFGEFSEEEMKKAYDIDGACISCSYFPNWREVKNHITKTNYKSSPNQFHGICVNRDCRNRFNEDAFISTGFYIYPKHEGKTIKSATKQE